MVMIILAHDHHDYSYSWWSWSSLLMMIMMIILAHDDHYHLWAWWSQSSWWMITSPVFAFICVYACACVRVCVWLCYCVCVCVCLCALQSIDWPADCVWDWPSHWMTLHLKPTQQADTATSDPGKPKTLASIHLLSKDPEFWSNKLGSLEATLVRNYNLLD